MQNFLQVLGIEDGGRGGADRTNPYARHVLSRVSRQKREHIESSNILFHYIRKINETSSTQNLWNIVLYSY